jgi:mono/diheme cytochrome c family protein
VLVTSFSLLVGFMAQADVGAPLSIDESKPLSPDSAELFQSIVATHCHQCHGDGEIKGDVNLVDMKKEADFLDKPTLLEDILAVLRDGEMPPEKANQPLSEMNRATLIASLETFLRESQSMAAFQPTPIRRVNRFQYNNAVKDLLDLKRDVFFMPERLMRRRSNYFDPKTGTMPNEVKVQNRPLGKDHDGERPEGFKEVAAFPQDRRAEHGFDNQADHLTLSPLLMEQFLQLSESIVDSKDLNPEECGNWEKFFAPPDGRKLIEVVRERMKPFMRLAFRRPVEREILDRFVAFAAKGIERGVGFTETMKTLVGATIASPDFLYLYHVENRAEEAPTGPERQRIDDFELASRLSFFFWVSIPDDELLLLAELGHLSDPDVLNAQIDRMMIDARSSRFCDIFPAQWLQLDRLISSIPDPKLYPDFYFAGYRASMHMMMEPLLLFETVYIEDRSVVELLDPPFTWRSEVLRSAREERSPKQFELQTIVYQRVPVSDRRWGGVITNPAVMTMTSNPNRSLPITRGAWVNAVIFNDPPPPPPADVPPLPEADDEKLSQLTIRERFAEHRKREDCAGCHRQIDPLGFALENYGPRGEWRDQYLNGREVDGSGNLFNQHDFSTVLEFKQSILKERRRFIRGFAAHLLSFALGRELGPADSLALDDIADRAMAGEDSLRTILKRVAMSEPFQHKNTRYQILREVNHEN